jgi:type IV pilus assembly protein PilA
MRMHWLACLVAVVGCKKEPAAPGVEAPAAPASTAEQDALWQLAPDGAQIGIVGSPRGLAMLERGAVAIDAALASAPDLAALHSKVLEVWTHATGSSTLGLAALGLSANQGFAMFGSDDDKAVLVLPVVDRDRFVALLHGHRGDVDIFDQDPLRSTVCKPFRGRYVCADKPVLFDKLGHGNLAARFARAGARGDLEVAGQGFPEAPGMTFAVGVQLEPGTVVVRGMVGGLPSQMTSALGNPIRPRDGAATSAGFGVIDVSPFLAALPPVPIARGVTAAQLGRSIAGPIDFAIPAGSRDFLGLDPALRILLNDPAPAQALVEHCADIPALQLLGPSFQNGACHMTIPSLGSELDAWVDGKALRIGRRAATRAVPMAASAMASELAQGAWSLALYGRGSYFSLANLPMFTAAYSMLPPALVMLPRIFPLFSELGIGLRKDGDAVHFVLGVRTVWANPPRVVDKVLAISSAQIISGQATEIARSIAASAPSSPFAQDFTAGAGGMTAVMAPLGVVAAVAVPAFMDYMKRSKKTEASLQLNKIGKNAKHAYVESGAFPRGRTGLTPPATCCGQGPPPNHCVTSLDDWVKNPVWHALDFEIDEPSLFRYSYESDGKTFTAQAVGDLDCDGIEITYRLNGGLDPATHKPTFTLTEPPADAD